MSELFQNAKGRKNEDRENETHRRLGRTRFHYRNWFSLPELLGPEMEKGDEEANRSENEEIETRERKVECRLYGPRNRSSARFG